MLNLQNIIVNADDLGLKTSVNKAILYCYEHQYINSTSLLTNMDCFAETVDLIHQNPVIKNIGVHVNLAEGKPLTNFKHTAFIDSDGNWDLTKTGKSINFLTPDAKQSFGKEVNEQIDRALHEKINIVHLDSHLHLHTLPHFFGLFLDIAKHRNLKLRLAQTYREGSYIKFYYRKYINNKLKNTGLNYSDFFETVDEFLKNNDRQLHNNTIEIMVHPNFEDSGKFVDHTDQTSIARWIDYLNKQ